MKSTETRLIPKELLFGNPEKAIPQISRDGQYLAWSEPVDGVLNVIVAPADDAIGERLAASDIVASGARVITNDTDRGVRAWTWGPDSRTILYMQDQGGDENWRVYITDIETRTTRDLTPFDEVRAHIAMVKSESPDHILVIMNRENPELNDVYRVTLSTGEMERLTQNPGNVIGWVLNESMDVVGAYTNDEEGRRTVHLRSLNNESQEKGDQDDVASWPVFREWDHEDALTSHVSGFNEEGSTIYLHESKGGNTTRLIAVDLESGEETVLAEDPVYDVETELRDRQTRRPVAVGIMREQLEWIPLDESVRDDIAFLQRESGGEFYVINRDDSDSRWVVQFNQSDHSPRSILYDRDSRQLQDLFISRPALEEYELAEMKPFSFTARDGLTIHGYITFPVGVESKNLPMVLNVHGGPWVRDTWGFDPEAQWLANRGYICMQVNYRGSTGYGKEFVNAGDREWGGKMHDDLIDAADWAVDQGYADRDRIAIMGGSYGGYATLVGATFTPDYFRCAAALVGPSNLITFINSIPPYWRPVRNQFLKRVGNPDTELDFLRSRSPLTRVDDIRIPLLIGHGANDPRVKQEESEQIVEAMKEKGIPHEYLLFPDEGHGFARPHNRLRYYEAVELFFSEHLGGRSENEADEVRTDQSIEENNA